MKMSAVGPVSGAAAIFTLFAALVYFSAVQPEDSGAHYSPATTKTEARVCPSKCFDYSVGSGAGRVDVNCEVAKRFVHRSLNQCSGIESYTVDREKICACPSVKVSDQACPRSCSGEFVCNVDAPAIDKRMLPCEGHMENSLISCRCELSGTEWKALT